MCPLFAIMILWEVSYKFFLLYQQGWPAVLLTLLHSLALVSNYQFLAVEQTKPYGPIKLQRGERFWQSVSNTITNLSSVIIFILHFSSVIIVNMSSQTTQRLYLMIISSNTHTQQSSLIIPLQQILQEIAISQTSQSSTAIPHPSIINSLFFTSANLTSSSYIYHIKLHRSQLYLSCQTSQITAIFITSNFTDRSYIYHVKLHWSQWLYIYPSSISLFFTSANLIGNSSIII